MSYDPNDRLRSVESFNHMSYQYSYDGAGNQQWDPLGGPGQRTVSFQYDSANRMIRRNLVNGQYLQFDWTEPDGRKRGNLVSKTLNSAAGTVLSTEAIYTWTEDNLLLRADNPEVGYSDYKYDAGGDRIHKLYSGGKEVYYVFNGLDVAYEEEITLDGTTTRYYIHALGRHVAKVEKDEYGTQKTYFFHADYLGSVRMISDDTSTVVWQKRYAPFGGVEEQSGTHENIYSYTGKGYDEDSDLHYFNARWYDSEIGRFISEDPLWGNVRDPQSLNRFAYGRNNPYRYTDPTGRLAILALFVESFTIEAAINIADVLAEIKAQNDYKNTLDEYEELDKAFRDEKNLLDYEMDKCLRDKRENNAQRNCLKEYQTGWERHVGPVVDRRDKARQDVLKKGKRANQMTLDPSNPSFDSEGESERDMDAINESNQKEIDDVWDGLN